MTAAEHSFHEARLEPPRHGGDLHRAAQRYAIPAEAWLDLSAALNPAPYPLDTLDLDSCHRLPSEMKSLIEAAQRYYGARHLVVLPGSQAAIQWLPLLRPAGSVAVPSLGYREHGFRWQWAGHRVLTYEAGDAGGIDALVADPATDVVVVINPNNPTGDRFPAGRLLRWREQLAMRGGWLLVDEAFADTAPEQSVASESHLPGLVVLRSLGKFFGLPGLRCGFALCEARLAERLTIAVGPWPLSGPTLMAATQALNDRAWQQRTRSALTAIRDRNAELLAPLVARWGGTVRIADLFISGLLPEARALRLQHSLARRGIWTRLVDGQPNALLRWGLVDPADKRVWQRYSTALSEAVPDQ